VTEASNFALNESLPGRVTSKGAAVWIKDVTADSSFVRTKRADNLGVKGAFGVPVQADGDTVAVLEFFSARPEEPDAKLMNAMESVGVQLSRVAERERAQEELRRSERRYRRLFETVQEGIVIQAADWTITDLNPATEDILGYERDELVGTNPADLFVDLDQYERAQQRIKEHGQFRDVQFDLRRKDGEVIVCEATSTIQRDADGEKAAFYTIFRDITERKRMREALEESEERYRRLFEESRDAIVLTTPGGTVVDVNDAAVDLFGYSRDELLRLDAAELYADPDERSRRIVPAIEEGPSSGLLEAEMRHCEGHTFLATAAVTVHQNEAGHPELIQALVRDITERRRLEEELLQVQDEERQRLGKELHDGVCSTLTAVNIKVSTAAAELRDDKSIDPSDLDEVSEYVKLAADEARAISHGLSPVGMEGGLLSALENLASQMEVRGELICSFEVVGSVPDLSEETATHLYRIAQEATTNAVKHAEAGHVWIRLEADDETLVLTIRDDGPGFASSESEGMGLGMRTMRYRANIVDASLTTEDALDGGALIRCELPLSGPS
jgi:PAS domain S-box-containing protein